MTDGHLGDGNYITQSFLLLVEDVNDNEPIFKPYPSAITVKEDASPGILATVEATDLDEGAYGQVYSPLFVKCYVMLCGSIDSKGFKGGYGYFISEGIFMTEAKYS